ncbi:hypothetical protein L1887_50257 [Cichorium endivia]|nr:hypothetical protein L1887_50257 [Cichorium endivia]
MPSLLCCAALRVHRPAVAAVRAEERMDPRASTQPTSRATETDCRPSRPPHLVRYSSLHRCAHHPPLFINGIIHVTGLISPTRRNSSWPTRTEQSSAAQKQKMDGGGASAAGGGFSGGSHDHGHHGHHQGHDHSHHHSHHHSHQHSHPAPAPVPAPVDPTPQFLPPQQAPPTGVRMAATGSAAGSRAAPTQGGEEAQWSLKDIYWRGRECKIITQNQNGPCSLIALCNILLLRGELTITHRIDLWRCPGRARGGTLDASAHAVRDWTLTWALTRSASSPPPQETAGRAEQASWRCFGCGGVPLVHGWLPDPADSTTYEAVKKAGSYNRATDIVVRGQTRWPRELWCATAAWGTLAASLASETSVANGKRPERRGWTEEHHAIVRQALALQTFLDNTSTQLTYNGLFVLAQEVAAGGACGAVPQLAPLGAVQAAAERRPGCSRWQWCSDTCSTDTVHAGDRLELLAGGRDRLGELGGTWTEQAASSTTASSASRPCARATCGSRRRRPRRCGRLGWRGPARERGCRLCACDANLSKRPGPAGATAAASQGPSVAGRILVPIGTIAAAASCWDGHGHGRRACARLRDAARGIHNDAVRKGAATRRGGGWGSLRRA